MLKTKLESKVKLASLIEPNKEEEDSTDYREGYIYGDATDFKTGQVLVVYSKPLEGVSKDNLYKILFEVTGEVVYRNIPLSDEEFVNKVAEESSSLVRYMNEWACILLTRHDINLVTKKVKGETTLSVLLNPIKTVEWTAVE